MRLGTSPIDFEFLAPKNRTALLCAIRPNPQREKWGRLAALADPKDLRQHTLLHRRAWIPGMGPFIALLLVAEIGM